LVRVALDQHTHELSYKHADDYQGDPCRAVRAAIQARFAPKCEPSRTLKATIGALNIARFALAARIIYSFLIDRIERALDELEPMNGGRWCTLTTSTMAARPLAVAAAILALLCSSANAVQPPSDHCRAASKIEYDSAKKQFLLRNRFGAYVRTGRIWRRHYWYCQL